jgi:serine/threonine-protein phosphatase 2A regulatory subunit A
LVVSDVIPLYRKLSSDDQDSVRLLTAQDLIAIAEILDDEETKSYLLPSIRSAVSDKSWRVRYMVADHFVEVSEDVKRVRLTGSLMLYFSLHRRSVTR